LKFLFKIFAFVLLCFLPTGIFASFLEWQTLESENFLVYYYPSKKYQALHLIEQLENNRDYVVNFSGNNISKTTIILEDYGIYPNGLADPVKSKSILFSAKASTSEYIKQYQDWHRFIGVHEIFHLAQFSKTNSSIGLCNKIFGNIFSPSLFTPMWLYEGFAVYAESNISKYEGRLNDAYYPTVIARKIKAGNFVSLENLTNNSLEFPIDYPYIFGAEFTRYLAKKYGKEKITEYIKILGNNSFAALGAVFPNLGFDAAAKETFNKDFPTLYKEWEKELKEKYNDFEFEGKQLTNSKWHKNYLTKSKENLYFYSYSFTKPQPNTIARKTNLYELDTKTNNVKKIKSFASSVQIPIKAYDNYLFYSLAQIEHNYANITNFGYGYTNSLYVYDTQEKTTKKLFTKPMLAFAVDQIESKTNISGIYTTALETEFGSEIWKFSNNKSELIGTTNYYISEIVALKKGSFFVVAKSRSNAWDIYRLETDKNHLSLSPITTTPESEMHLSLDNNFLYFTANKNDKYTIYRYSIIENNFEKMTSGNYADYGVAINDKLYFQDITGSGEEIFCKQLLPQKVSYPTINRTLPTSNFNKENLSEKSFLSTDTLSLFPYVRMPILALGEDHLGLISYDISYETSLGLNTSVGLKLFAPLSIYLNSNSLNTYLYTWYPLHKSLTAGLTTLNLAYKTDFYTETIPYLEMEYSLPDNTTRASMQYDTQTKGSALEIINTLDVGNNSIQITYARYNDINWYEILNGAEITSFEDASGDAGKIEFFHKLFDIKEGCWLPLIYFDSIFGNLFWQHSSIKEINSAVAYRKGHEAQEYGYEFQMEFKALFSFKGLLSLGWKTDSFTSDSYLEFSLGI
jgi:hypothetical protein